MNTTTATNIGWPLFAIKVKFLGIRFSTIVRMRMARLVSDNGFFRVAKLFKSGNTRVFLKGWGTTHDGDVRSSVGGEAVLLDDGQADATVRDSIGATFLTRLLFRRPRFF